MLPLSCTASACHFNRIVELAYSVNPDLAYSGGETFLDQLGSARKMNFDPFRDRLYALDKIDTVCKQTSK